MAESGIAGLPEDWPVLADSVALETAQDVLFDAGLSDGLPLIPPTHRRLTAMLDCVADPALSLGFIPPLFGDLTIAAVAYCCAIAGCAPTALPVVATAASATLEPEFNLLGLMTTTGAAAVATIVHGPAVQRLGMNASVNCLGPGNRANATIGRAMSLVLRNIGGAKENAGDMATAGQPGKYGFCFGEAADTDLAPLHVRRGLAARDDAVTVIGVSGTAEILPVEGRETPEAILDPIAASMRTAFQVNGALKQPEQPEHAFILPPELALQIRQAGWDLDRICAYLLEASRYEGRSIATSAAHIFPIITGGPGVKIAHFPSWGGGTRMVTRKLMAL